MVTRNITAALRRASRFPRSASIVAPRTRLSGNSIARPLTCVVSRSISTTPHPRRPETSSGTLPTQTPTDPAPSSSALQTYPKPSHDPDAHKTVIEWNDGEISRFHDKWLFDHCRCAKCFHPVTKQRMKGLLDIPEDIKPITLHPTASGLSITWSTSSPHTSFYPWSILYRTSYDPKFQSLSSFSALSRAHNPPDPFLEPSPHPQRSSPDGFPHEAEAGREVKTRDSERILWNASIAKSPPTVTYSSLMVDAEGKEGKPGVDEETAERGMKRLLEKVHDFGFCFITSVPVNPTDTESVINRISPIRQTHYGGFWDFTADLKMGDMAYTNEALPAHTDNTYFTDPAGLQIFHLLSHPPPGQGGATLLVDSFYTASILAQLHPSAYKILSTLPIPTHASGSAGAIFRPHPTPVLSHDRITGELVQVRWNNEDRGILGGGNTSFDSDRIEGWYDSARKWEEAVRAADSEYWVQLKPGMMVVIDNWRVMHGRSGFSGDRRMCGAYVGRDEWCSRLEVLRRRFDAVKGEEKGEDGQAGELEKWRDGW